MLPQILLGLGMYLLYKELTEKKEVSNEESGNHSDSSRNSGRSIADDSQHDRDSLDTKKPVRKERKRNVQQSKSNDVGNESVDPGVSEQGEPVADSDQGGINVDSE